jgi:hypothetical protein
LEHPCNKTLSLRGNFEQLPATGTHCEAQDEIRKRMRSKLQEVKQQLRSRMALLAA